MLMRDINAIQYNVSGQYSFSVLLTLIRQRKLEIEFDQILEII